MVQPAALEAFFRPLPAPSNITEFLSLFGNTNIYESAFYNTDLTKSKSNF